MDELKLIGIGGTNGSGKDSLAEFLAQAYGWLFISTSGDLIIPELKRRVMPLERQHMAALTAEWRREVGKGAVVDRAVERFEQESKKHKFSGLVIASLRHPWEVDRLHELGGQLVWTDADPQVRYNRIFKRGQGDKDKKSFEQFLAEEKAEMAHRDGDEATLNMGDVKAKADVFITNNSNDLEAFKKAAQKALGLV